MLERRYRILCMQAATARLSPHQAQGIVGHAFTQSRTRCIQLSLVFQADKYHAFPEELRDLMCSAHALCH